MIKDVTEMGSNDNFSISGEGIDMFLQVVVPFSMLPDSI